MDCLRYNSCRAEHRRSGPRPPPLGGPGLHDISVGRARSEAFTLHQTGLGTEPSPVKCYSVNGAIDRITHELDLGNTTINIYIDLSKAFDTLDHNILISKLQHYGFKGAALQLLISYLSNRKQFVQYGDTLSQKTDISMGIHQGSILGPFYSSYI